MREYQSLSQNDPRWKNEKLGTSQSTIGGWGCALVSVTIAARYFGKDILPPELDKKLEPYYIDGNLMNWTALTKIYPDIQFVEKLTTYDDAKAKQYLADPSYFVICCVDATPLGMPKGTHFFPLLGDGKILDVFDGQFKSFSAYPTSLGLRVYKGAPRPITTPPTTETSYRGYDLINLDSMKVCVDLLIEVQKGDFIRTTIVSRDYLPKTQIAEQYLLKSEAEQRIKDGIADQTTLAEGYKKQFDDLWQLILTHTPSEQISLHDDAKLMAYFERYTATTDQLTSVLKEKETFEQATQQKVTGLQNQVIQLQTDLETLQTRAKYLSEELTQVQAEKKRISRIAKVLDRLFLIFNREKTKYQLSELNTIKGKEPDAKFHQTT